MGPRERDSSRIGGLPQLGRVQVPGVYALWSSNFPWKLVVLPAEAIAQL